MSNQERFDVWLSSFEDGLFDTLEEAYEELYEIKADLSPDELSLKKMIGHHLNELGDQIRRIHMGEE